MKDGNWIPLDKNLIKTISKNRPYSYIEAMFSLSYDIDNGKVGSINGYSKLWNWSRNKVRKMLNELGTVQGHKADRQGTYEGHLIILKNKNKKILKDNSGTVEGQLKDRKRYTTIYPEPKPIEKNIVDNGFNQETSFEEIWLKYPNKDGKKYALKHFKASVKNVHDLGKINLALKNYLNHLKVETWKRPKNGSTWFNNWIDWYDWVEPENPEATI